MYESHYHLGVALQYMKEPRRAVTQFTKAIEAVEIPKVTHHPTNTIMYLHDRTLIILAFLAQNGCMAGCMSNSCLMTPLYARRSYAYCQMDDLNKALVDAEKAVVLDNTNPVSTTTAV